MPITINTARKPKGAASGTAEGGQQVHAPKWVTVLIETGIIILAIALAFLVRHSVYDVAVVTSRSMEPTLMVGDRVAFDHRRSLHGQWRRGDVVFFDPPAAWQDSDQSVLVKRLIGLPGETVEVRQGHVFVDDQEVEAGAQEDNEDSVPPLKLGDKEYFVLGDNRLNSADSRKYGPIESKDIRGRAVLRLWPSPGRLPAWP